VKLPLVGKWSLGLVTLLAALLVVLNLAIGLSLRPLLIRQIRANLTRSTVLAAEAFVPGLAAVTAGGPTAAADSERINQRAHELSKQTGFRVTIIALDGKVLGESDLPPSQLAEMENHFLRPEVQEALQRGVGSSLRYSKTLKVDLMYVAAAVTPSGIAGPSTGSAEGTAAGRLGFVRLAIPLHDIALTTRHVQRTVAIVSFLVGLIAIPFLFWLARRYSGPIDAMRQMATRVAVGDFAARAPERIGGELGELADALNQMSTQLQTRLRELTAEKVELNATLANMIEGVLVVDAACKIRLANDALRRQFNLPESALGKTVTEAFRSVPLQDLVSQALGSEQVSARELSFFGPEERVFDVNATCLRGRDGSPTGVVVVFHDITRIKQLENIRKEFVANVSHELRTPLSIIKGYVETLLDEQPPDEPTAKQFLQTIEKHSRRLEALIGDLLSISELESQQARLNLAAVSLRTETDAVLEELKQRAREKNMTMVSEIPENCPAVRADAQRLHQVLFNLLDNAIKYTQAGGRAVVSAKEKDGEVEICVADNGPGIAAEHLPRIFERFYRVDKARSREVGGTGLGLSIVKHIIQAHGGRVWVESHPGKGSSFYFTLPRT
jgi:two-component system, OmpR family, phosphate regulon sensor histidine kinase PhoR